MFREHAVIVDARPRFPHACGDVPERGLNEYLPLGFSPRLWGCSVFRVSTSTAPRVFPTPVGMFRASASSGMRGRCFPHACGDVPTLSGVGMAVDAFSPRLWGCSDGFVDHVHLVAVFPTPVGMFRDASISIGTNNGFPHACGDVPISTRANASVRVFSPRLWGCSGELQGRGLVGEVFPTPVGMFRRAPSAPWKSSRFPHACGDVPDIKQHGGVDAAFSPRLWGCSGA